MCVALLCGEAYVIVQRSLSGSMVPLCDVLMDKRVLIVDDNASVRGLVRAFIELRPGIKVCGEASDGFEGVEKGLELKPDVIILDFSMPRINGLQAALMLHQASPHTPIILFTIHNNTALERAWLTTLAWLQSYRRQIN